jgi:hypothetical protein
MLPAINWPQTVGSREGQHPPRILRGKSADLVQLPKLVPGEREFDRLVFCPDEVFTNDTRVASFFAEEIVERTQIG